MAVALFACSGAPDVEQIAAIAALEDRVLRNLLITQTYHQLALALADLLGVDHANWCSFATWASKQAGHTIRGEDLPERVYRLLPEHPLYHDADRAGAATMLERVELELVHRPHLDEYVETLMERLSAAIADGNLRVFAELAPLFARFLAVSDDDAFAAFLAELRPGPTDDGGQDILRAAFGNYRAAALEPDAKRKIDLIFMANVQIGLHEQTRLQPNIAAGLDTPAEVVGGLLERIVGAFGRRIVAVLPAHDHARAAAACAPHANRLAEAVIHVWCREATDHIMKLAMPGMVLHLGHDVPRLPHGAMFPDDLAELEHVDLTALARRYDRSWNTTVGTAASDWTSLADRMHYIIDLFRSRHRERTLHEPPFSAQQVAEMAAGRVAAGPL